MKLSEQVILEVKSQAEELDRLQYGEVSLVVKEGRLVRWDMLKQFKVEADPKNGRLKRKA